MEQRNLSGVMIGLAMDPLKEMFPDIYNLVQQPQASVAEVCSLEG